MFDAYFFTPWAWITGPHFSERLPLWQNEYSQVRGLSPEGTSCAALLKALKAGAWALLPHNARFAGESKPFVCEVQYLAASGDKDAAALVAFCKKAGIPCREAAFFESTTSGVLFAHVSVIIFGDIKISWKGEKEGGTRFQWYSCIIESGRETLYCCFYDDGDVYTFSGDDDFTGPYPVVLIERAWRLTTPHDKPFMFEGKTYFPKTRRSA